MQCCSVLCAVPTQPYSQYGKRRWHSCPTAAPCGPFGAQPSASGNLIASQQAHFSTITRLPSGSSISRSVTFRDGAFGVGVGTAHGCTRRFLRSARAQRRHSRRLFVVRCAILSRMHAVWLRAEYRPSPSGTPSRSLPHPAEFSPLGLLSHFASLRRAISRVSRFPYCGASAP